MSSQDRVVVDVNLIKSNPQGGKQFALNQKVQESDLDRIGKQYLQSNPDAKQADVDKYKKKFMLFDLDHSGDINMQELQAMMEKLGQPKTHLELKKMIAQVDKSGSGAIDYIEFLEMMLGKGDTSILKKILMFEELGKPAEQPQKGSHPQVKKNLW
eukprot:TRINITY_DN11478_c0_g1_i1.p1 TRINITY_DN11478_c0_g1~~TRINITY_DN11478_c0_g1_i1.p1  ORF type:complete len:156 (-),score=43.95 TRINITY_DN11478_c0_g1_i1:73-540(-)